MNRPQLTVFNFSLKNQSDNAVDIFIDGDIVDADTQSFLKDYWGDETSTSYKSFRDTVNKSEANTFNVYINSPGGQVTEAMAIHDLLQDLQTKGKTVNTIGRGIIASSATYILMAGKTPSMSSNSWFMVHNVSGVAFGTVNEIENYAASMRKFNDKINSFYQNFTGLSKTVISNLMDAETWLTADEAQSKGFVKNVTGSASFTNSIKPEQWLFNNKAVLNSYNSFTKTNSNPDTMDTSKITDAITNGFNSLMEKLGVKDKANDEGVKNAFTEFSTSITNALGEIKTPDEASIKTIVNDAIAEGLKSIGKNEAFKSAVANSFKEVPKNFTDAIAEATKNSVTKEDFETGMKNLTDSVIEKIGGVTPAGEGIPKNKAKKVSPKNRFAAAYDDYYEN